MEQPELTQILKHLKKQQKILNILLSLLIIAFAVYVYYSLEQFKAPKKEKKKNGGECIAYEKAVGFLISKLDGEEISRRDILDCQSPNVLITDLDDQRYLITSQIFIRRHSEWIRFRAIVTKIGFPADKNANEVTFLQLYSPQTLYH